MPPGVAVAVGGLVLTSFALYQLGYALTAQPTPYGFAFVIGGVCLLVGGGLLLAAWLERRRYGGTVTTLAAVLGLTATTGALTLGLLQVPADQTQDGPLCRALNGNVYDCDDPRIDEPQEKVEIDE